MALGDIVAPKFSTILSVSYYYATCWSYYLEMWVGLQLIHATKLLDGEQCFHQTNVSQGQTGPHQETRPVLL